MEIKQCSAQDIDSLKAVLAQSYKENYAYLWLDNGVNYMQQQFNHTSFEKQLADKNTAFYLIFEDSQPVGVLKLNLDKAIQQYADKEALELERIYLLKTALGKGTGRQVMAYVESLAKERGKQVVWLKAMDSSKALGFYEKCGYAITDHFPLNLAYMKDEYRNSYLMVKVIA